MGSYATMDVDEWLDAWDEMLSCKPNSEPWKRRDAQQQRIWERLSNSYLIIREYDLHVLFFQRLRASSSSMSDTR